MKRRNIDSISSGNFNVVAIQLVPCWHGHQRPGWRSRLVAALLAIASAVACGGGGGSSSQRVQVGVQLSSSSVAFGSQLANVASAAQTVTVTNNGSLAVAFTAIKVTGDNAGDFVKTADTCFGVSLSSLGTCTVSVRFTPFGTGNRSAGVNITDNAPDSPQTVTLSGTGTAPAVSLSAPGLAFASQLKGTTSAAQTETITNTGNDSLIVSTVVLAGTNVADFAASSDTCTGATVAPNRTCTVSVTFTPSGTGDRGATLNFADNASNSPQGVNLSGTGIAPAVSFSAPTLSVGTQSLGTTSTVHTETITNSGTANLNISTVTLAGANAADFAKTADTCTGSTVAPNGTCAINVKFTPSALGTRSAQLNIADNASDSPQVVSMSGVGDAPAACISSPILTFSDQNLGTTSTPQPVTVTNTGTVDLSISTVTLGGTNAGDFAKSSDKCTGATLTPNSACTVNVTFKPLAAGTRSASLTFTDNTSNSPQAVSMTGMGTVPMAGISSSSLTFSHQNVGTTSTAETVTVTNAGTGKLNLSTITIGGTNAANFAKSADTCTGATVTTASACTVSVTFTPSAMVSYSASLNFTDNASSSPQTVSLSGTGTAPVAGLSSPSLAFSSQDLGTTSAAQTVIVTNTGTSNLSIATVAIGGANAGDFAKYGDNCTGATIMPASVRSA